MRNAARMEGVTRPFCFELTREDVDFDDGRRKHSWRVNPHSMHSGAERSGDDKCDVIKNQTAKCTAAAAAAATGDDGGGRGSGTDRDRPLPRIPLSVPTMTTGKKIGNN